MKTIVNICSSTCLCTLLFKKNKHRTKIIAYFVVIVLDIIAVDVVNDIIVAKINYNKYLFLQEF